MRDNFGVRRQSASGDGALDCRYLVILIGFVKAMPIQSAVAAGALLADSKRF